MCGISLRYTLLLIALALFCHATVNANGPDKSIHLKLINTYRLPGLFGAFGGGGTMGNAHDSIMYYQSGLYDYVPEIQGIYARLDSDLTKLTLSSGEVEIFSLDFDARQKNQDSWQSFRSIEKDNTLWGEYRWGRRSSIVSPNGKYILFRYFPKKQELYEVQSGKLLSCGVDDEIILGFDHSSNIYCGRQSLENLFVLRNPLDMSLLRKYKTKDYESPISDNTDESRFYGIQFSNCHPPITTPDGRSTVLVFTTYHLQNQIALLFVIDNPTNTVIHRSCLNLRHNTNLKYQFRPDGKLLGIPDGRNEVWVYDFERNFSRSYEISEANYQGLAGFCFTPDDHMVLWTTHRADTRIGGPGHTAYRFDLRSGESEAFTDFSVQDRYTRSYFFSPDGKTVITFETVPGRYLDREYYGRYVFWDFPSKKRLLETEETYLPNIIIAPDWKTIYLTKTTYRPPTHYLSPGEPLPPYEPFDVEVYDITGIMERED